MLSALLRLGFLASLIVLQPLFAEADHYQGFNSYGSYGANAWNNSGVPPYFDDHSYGDPGYPGSTYQRAPLGGQNLQQAITQFYLTYIGRPPEPAGMQSWINHIRFRGGNLQEVKIGIMSSDECFSRFNRRPEAYVQFLYLQETGRYPSGHELRFWLRRFRNYGGNLNLFCRDLVSNVW